MKKLSCAPYKISMLFFIKVGTSKTKRLAFWKWPRARCLPGGISCYHTGYRRHHSCRQQTSGNRYGGRGVSRSSRC
jgi:hypothetical protein